MAQQDGSYWTGYQLVEDLLWPDEKPTWTAGAILLAADALTEHTPAAKLFCSVQLLDGESGDSSGASASGRLGVEPVAYAVWLQTPQQAQAIHLPQVLKQA